MLILFQVIHRMIQAGFTYEDTIYLLTELKSGGIHSLAFFEYLDIQIPEDELLTRFIDALHKPNAINSVAKSAYFTFGKR